jgi:hypothetical protein
MIAALYASACVFVMVMTLLWTTDQVLRWTWSYRKAYVSCLIAIGATLAVALGPTSDDLLLGAIVFSVVWLQLAFMLAMILVLLKQMGEGWGEDD